MVVGSLRDDEERDAVSGICEMLNLPMFCDVTSGLRLGKNRNQISYYDLILSSDKFAKKFQPDTILHLGGRFTSNRLQRYIEHSLPGNYLQVNQTR